MALGLFGRTKSNGRANNATATYLPADKPQPQRDALRQALADGRFALILTHPEQWQKHPERNAGLTAAERAVDERFALVPDGLVTIPLTIFDQPGQPERDATTAPFLLARHAVTNAQYQAFIDGGGYEDLNLWPEDIWPHLIGFKDITGHPGPRFWRQGRHDKRQAHVPVVGINWYEADAYANWTGFRLPTEEEWQMAATWRARSAAQSERRYPWGDGLDLTFCNIWAAGHARILPVDACRRRARAPNGVLQLIGNAWEWTSSDFDCTDRDGRPIVGDTLLKSIRGGAYDTYFPWQATSTFRSALGCLSRVHNVGLRLVLDLPGEDA